MLFLSFTVCIAVLFLSFTFCIAVLFLSLFVSQCYFCHSLFVSQCYFCHSLFVLQCYFCHCLYHSVISVIHCLYRSFISVFLSCRNLNTVRAISKEHEHPVDRYSVMAKWYVTRHFAINFHALLTSAGYSRFSTVAKPTRL